LFHIRAAAENFHMLHRYFASLSDAITTLFQQKHCSSTSCLKTTLFHKPLLALNY